MNKLIVALTILLDEYGTRDLPQDFVRLREILQEMEDEKLSQYRNEMQRHFDSVGNERKRRQEYVDGKNYGD